MRDATPEDHVWTDAAVAEFVRDAVPILRRSFSEIDRREAARLEVGGVPEARRFLLTPIASPYGEPG
jgi:hypothetical protein